MNREERRWLRRHPDPDFAVGAWRPVDQRPGLRISKDFFTSPEERDFAIELFLQANPDGKVIIGR